MLESSTPSQRKNQLRGRRNRKAFAKMFMLIWLSSTFPDLHEIEQSAHGTPRSERQLEGVISYIATDGRYGVGYLAVLW
jgi:hypothetical protein